MELYRGSGLYYTANSNSKYVINMRMVDEIDNDIALTATLSLKSKSLVVVIKLSLNNSRMREFNT
jgi:hypothetical protein